MKHMEIAVYGKGGIGKSTISANITAALADRGLRVLQIGCDPKHDSTRALMQGERIPTVLDVLREKGKDGAVIEDVLRRGYKDCGCIEAGGPQPGVGCAGRGIISAFEFLGKYSLRESYDRVIYDVLGDVVCGGFAVPVRREYADCVFLVTSGEYMALYAANNILRGIRNFDSDRYSRVAGIIYNERKLEDEDARVKRFADAVGLPVLAKVPRSEAFALAEERNMTLMQLEGALPEKKVFDYLAELISSPLKMYTANPLTDEDHERIVLGKGSPASVCVPFEAETMKEEAAALQHEAASPAAVRRRPLYGCAFNGAATTAVHLTDAVVIAHGPKACAFYTWQNISSPGRRNIFNRGVLMPSSISPNFESTDISHNEAVFGGMDLLRKKVKQALDRKPGAVIVISTCVSGIIGDDLASIEELSTEEVPVIALATDGDLAGDYMEGLRMAQETILRRLADRGAKEVPMSVNIIGETAIASNAESNYQVIKNLLDMMGIKVNCRYFGGCTTDELRGFMSAPLNILAANTSDALELKEHLEKEYCCRFLDAPLPIGLQATSEWLMALGEEFDCRERAREIIQHERRRYDEAIERVSRQLKGKRVFLTAINARMDWLLDTVLDAGMEFCHIGVLNYMRTPLIVTENPDRLSMISEITSPVDTAKLQKELHPDIVISAYTVPKGEDEAIYDVIPMLPDLGILSAVVILERWISLMETNRKGSWENDRELFEKYYS